MVEDESEKVQRRSLRKRTRLREDYRAVFGTDAGQRVLADLFRSCVLEHVGYIQQETALHRQGRGWAFARIFKMLSMKDEELMRITRENT